MLASSIPYKFKTPWGASATAPQYLTTQIPATSVGAAAGQDLGFPPATATDPAAGGTPPNINDVNGMMFYETSWTQWVQAGGPVHYDGTFSTNIGGYPKGAVLSAASLGAFWLSMVDSNTSDPDTGGAGWTAFSTVHGEQVISTSGNFTVPAGVYSLDVELWASGAGGGGSDVGGAGGSGGGAGGYTAGPLAVTPGQVIAATVGAPGAAGAGGGSPTNGTAGGTTSFGALNATGGTPGLAGVGGLQSSHGTGGTGSGGSLNFLGQNGNIPVLITSPNIIQSATGGSAWKSPAEVAGISGTVGNGGGSTYPGTGGGGGINGGGGGAGGVGLIIVRW